jgi:HlyD family secretion protein
MIVLLFLGLACRREQPPDAYGNVEATEVVVSAESSGKIEAFSPRDGDHLVAGAIVGRIETTQQTLERDQVGAQRAVTASRLDEIAQQIDSLEVQRRIAGRAYERTRRLYAKQAATAQQLDQTERDYRVLGEQIEAARAQTQTIRREVAAAEARVAQVSQRIEKGEIVNPINGVVLATYARAGEVAQTGQPLYRIANLENMEVRAYITEEQLATTRVGQQVQVTVDVGEKQRKAVPGTVTWISPDAEFTPTPIQTREERTDLVYAIKIRVSNPGGLLKIGMPADVELGASNNPSSAFGTFSPHGGEKGARKEPPLESLLPAHGEKVPKADEGRSA